MKAEIVDLLTAMGVQKKREGDLGRARAYMLAAREIARTPDFDERLRQGNLRDVKGVGKSIEATIRRFAETGERPDWLQANPMAAERLEVPPSWAEAPFSGVPDIHCHTIWSDGTLTVDELAAVAKRLGHRAIGVADHSGSLRIARGLDPDTVRGQWADVARVQDAHPDLRILRGTECDILRDGTLDHPPELLEEFDFVIGSLHTQLKLPEAEQTERLLTALDDPHLTTVGHPTTRVPGHRGRANLDLDRVFEKAADRGVALEVNGNPGRIDLDADLARRALEAGCRVSLGSDAHSAREMLAFEDARRIAEEAGATEEQIVNFDLLQA